MPTPTAELHYNIAVALYNEGRIDESIAAYSRAIAADPEFGPAYNNRGYAAFTQGRLAEALADLDQAVRLNPENAGALSNRAAVLAGLERYDEALASVTQAIALNPRTAQTFSDRGGIHLGRGDVAKAEDDLKRALALDPDCATAHYLFGALHGRTGGFLEAYRSFVRAAQLGLTAAHEAIDHALKNLYVQALEDHSIGRAIEGFLDAQSEEDFRTLADERPYVLLPEFHETLLPYGEITGVRERALILREMARERGLS